MASRKWILTHKKIWRVIRYFRYMRRQWPDSVALSMFFAIIFSLTQIINPHLDIQLSKIFNSTISEPSIRLLGFVLLGFIVYAIVRPRDGGVAATFFLGGERILVNVHPFNVIGVLFWLAILVFSLFSLIRWHKLRRKYYE